MLRKNVVLFVIIKDFLSVGQLRQSAADMPDVVFAVHGGEEKAQTSGFFLNRGMDDGLHVDAIRKKLIRQRDCPA